MASYIHHVPGRLRVKTQALKSNGVLAKKTLAVLEATEGVLEASINTVTGSVIVRYDVRRFDEPALMALLREAGCMMRPPLSVDRVKPTGDMARRVGNTGESVGNLVVGVVAEKLIERSATALLAAIL